MTRCCAPPRRRAVQDVGRHDGAVLGEGVGQVFDILSTLQGSAYGLTQRVPLVDYSSQEALFTDAQQTANHR
jgi:hypothetical protein